MSVNKLGTQIPESHLSCADGDPNWLWAGRVPSLDGLRAVAIGLVIAAHSIGTPNAPFPMSFWAFGDLGVQLFFVISGFLITLLLIRERKRRGRISLKQFYFRRAVRILPAFLTFMAFLCFLQLLGAIFIDEDTWLLSLTFTLNLQPETGPWNVGHIWSLCVEEHFYLLWPPLVAVLGLVWSWRIAWFSVLTAPLWRWAIGIQYHGVFDPQTFTFARMDAIAMGCCLAITLTVDRTGTMCKFSRVRTVAVWISIFALFITARLFSTAGLQKYHLGLLLTHTLQGTAFTLLLWISVCVPNGWVGHMLNVQPVVWIGVLSYSLYLWQQPFLDRSNPSWMCVWPINLILAVSLATCSYLAVERPLLRWRQRHGSVA